MDKNFIIEKMNTANIQAVFEKKGYTYFSKGAMNLNIFGIRASANIPNTFDDFICVYYNDNNANKIELNFPATTDPGTFWLQNPMAKGGTAILAEGQYRGAYKLGQHYGHEALVQILPLPCYRDDNRDDKIDTNQKTITTGLYGINIHSAWWVEEAEVIDKASAGCQVCKRRMHHKQIIELCKLSAKIYGNKFTYTLLNEKDFN